MSKHKKGFTCYCNECGGTQRRRTGNCYEVSAHYAVKHQAYLVHGRITAPADLGPVPHSTLDHAWCELTGPFGVPMVWEPVHGKILPKTLWDGRYSAERDAVYSAEDTRQMVLKHKHFGPWEE
jgi:hypothetical protein